MPLIDIRTNLLSVSDDFLCRFAQELGKTIEKKSKDIEVSLTTNAKIIFNGDFQTPAAHISYQTTDLEFTDVHRRQVIKEISLLVKKYLDVKASRLFIRVEQLKHNEVGISGHLYSDLMKKSKL
ncbi:hypothetical protein M3Y97_01014400 [Aphelenchoides bicaudatus]|nr:hypothetical protein M3Y97_01014400 [Aphelenchoides bicaudatus]